MGTNYYHRFNICDHCGRYDERHIGKASGGWTFSFQGYHATEDWRGIHSLEDWKDLFSDPTTKIFDEYGDEISVLDFLAIVANHRGCERNHTIEARKHPGWPQDDWLDPEGHSFSGGEFS